MWSRLQGLVPHAQTCPGHTIELSHAPGGDVALSRTFPVLLFPSALLLLTLPPTHTLFTLTSQVALREEMERALKESVREAERQAAREKKSHSAVDAEYLKNTVLKMYRTGEVRTVQQYEVGRYRWQYRGRYGWGGTV